MNLAPKSNDHDSLTRLSGEMCLRFWATAGAVTRFPQQKDCVEQYGALLYEPDSDMSASEKELQLHRDILNKKDVALSELFVLYGDKIAQILTHKFNALVKRDPSYVMEAVNDALLGYYVNPSTFNPMKFKLFSFLLLAAKRDLQNILKREEKHLKKKELPEDVELLDKYWNTILKPHSSTDDTFQLEETMTAIQRMLESHFFNERDIQLAWMILARERETEVFIEVLEMDLLTIEEQRNEVKKHKDRIKKVLERNDVENRIKSLLR